MSANNDDYGNLAPNELPIQHRSSLLGVIFGVGTAAILFTLLMTAMLPSSGAMSPLIGKQAPAIQVEGWLNEDGPTAEDLMGKVIVIDAWAYWCGPCRESMPEVINLYKKYHPQGVVFLGLTGEGRNKLEQSQRFVKQTGIPWPNGYGANEPLIALNADTIPQKWVIDHNNVIIWDQYSTEPIERAIERALKAAASKETTGGQQ